MGVTFQSILLTKRIEEVTLKGAVPIDLNEEFTFAWKIAPQSWQKIIFENAHGSDCIEFLILTQEKQFPTASALFFVSLEAGSLSTPPRENAVLSCMYIGVENFGVEKIVVLKEK